MERKISRRQFLQMLGLGATAIVSNACSKGPVRWTRTDKYPGYEAKQDIKGTNNDGESCVIPANSPVTIENHVIEGGSGPDLSVEATISDKDGCTQNIRSGLFGNPLRRVSRLVEKTE